MDSALPDMRKCCQLSSGNRELLGWEENNKTLNQDSWDLLGCMPNIVVETWTSKKTYPTTCINRYHQVSKKLDAQ